MTLHTPNYAFPYGELSDQPDGATQMENLAIAIDTQVKSNADSATAAVIRSALLTTLLGGATTQTKQFATTDTVATTTATSIYADLARVTTGALCGVTFHVPPSGTVKVEWNGSFHSSLASGSTVFVGASVSTGGVIGSGTSVSAAADNEAIQIDGTNNTPGSKWKYVSGLNPGDVLNAWIQWRNSGAATASGFTPSIGVSPVLA